jgi:tetratricopeptide (TPR) repeat protein
LLLVTVPTFAAPPAPRAPTAVAPPAPIDKVRLRMLPQLPVYALNTSIMFNEAYGFYLGWTKPDPMFEIVALRKSLRGDATDANIHRQIGKLYQSLQMPEAARESFGQSAKLYFDQIKANPGDGWLRAQYADAWSESADRKRRADAEPVFRQALQVAPNDWRCWMLMAGYLQRAVKDRFLDDIVQVKVDPKARQAELDRLLAETRQCLERTATLAPREPQVFADRAFIRSQMGQILGLLRIRQGERVNIYAEAFAPECVDDLKTTARLKGDARAIGVAAFAELLSVRLRQDPKQANVADVWKSLPEPTRQSLQQSRASLDQIRQTAQPRDAAEACEMMGMLDASVWGDHTKAEADFREAIAKDATRDASWHLLLISIMNRPGNDTAIDFVSVCNERLKKMDSPAYHLHLARVYERSNYEASAKSSLEAALKADPRDFDANLAQAVYLMKHSDDSALPNVLAYLTRASDAAREVPTVLRRSRLAAAQGVYLALTGNVAEAKQRLKEASELDPSSEWIREAFDLLGG